jgi:NhaP-type Na+/H+ or K+/H+ antiporter
VEPNPDAHAALTVALALTGGMVAQALARHMRLPGIVLLLATGVVLGPDVADVIQPEALGSALYVLVGFAVAVILFEGGMNLNLKRLRAEAGVIQRLLTVGALITMGGAALAARLIMGWDWSLAIAFGSLVIVTGPTVVTPLLRRIKVKHTVSTVLEAEGVLIDAIGAVVAVVTLEVLVVSSVTTGLLDIIERLGLGMLLGLTGGFLLAILLRYKRVVPEGLENVFTLSLVVGMFQVSNVLLPESGIITVTVAGMVVGNSRIHVQRDLLEFKEQLTVMLIGMLFVLLAADVRLDEVLQLGLPAVLTVAALMLIVRPLNIFVSTLGSGLSRREKTFLSWLAPRGVVAAAVATLFAQTLAAAGIEGGKQLQALVFLVIAVTVVVQGLTGGPVAHLLGLRRRVDHGYAILGANELGLTIGRLLRMNDQDVAFIDSNPAACKAAEEDGFRVVYGNAVNERTLQRAQIEDRRACVAVTPNEEINLLFARTAIDEFKLDRVLVAVRRHQSTVNPKIVQAAGAEVLFGSPRDLDMWSVRLRRGFARLESWKLNAKDAKGREGEGEPDQNADIFGFPRTLLLPMVVVRGGEATPIRSGRELRKGDVVHFAVQEERADDAAEWLALNDWELVEQLDKDAPVSGLTEQKPTVS